MTEHSYRSDDVIIIYVMFQKYIINKTRTGMFPKGITNMLCTALRVAPSLLGLMAPPPPILTTDA